MTILIGEVIAVLGMEITLRAFDNSNHETHFYNGTKYQGISIREFISIAHGFRRIICVIEGEYLDERTTEKDGEQLNYIRKLKARPIGYFEDAIFKDGIKFLPKIGEYANLLSEKDVRRIFERFARKDNDGFIIGKLMKEEIKLSLPWYKIFNSHLGIFGNTGSGKSNTLTNLFTVLFTNKINDLKKHSRFIFLDFNGEYTGQQLVEADHKKVIHLRTRHLNVQQDKFTLSNDQFWDAETLGILFQATENTQKPFLRRVVSGRAKYADNSDSLNNYTRSIFERALTSENPTAEILEYLKGLSRRLDIDNVDNANQKLIAKLNSLGYHRKQSCFYYPKDNAKLWFNSKDEFLNLIKNVTVKNQSVFDELQIRTELKLISDLLDGSVQYEHIQPLMRRISAVRIDLDKVIKVDDNEDDNKVVTVISLKNCKQDIKKILPILIARQYYEKQKEKVASPPNTTLHLVIDEAHNILSQQSNREAESWKDYRLELFEEIIKEGRKFGVFITLSSQRPADISPTIISQLHNYFIHRLVNDKDLALLENTISTLDTVSRSQIPNLPQGGCVVTGTTFDIPMLLQIDRLPSDKAPDSRDVDLEKLWRSSVDNMDKTS